MHRGSCLCGAVTYEITGEIGNGYFCHCKRCRKAGGSAFAANARIAPEQFRLLSGAEFLKAYHAATGLTRKFCSECGSAILSERSEPVLMAIRLGTLDTPLERSPIVGHIFVDSMAEWDRITDDLPRFAERPTR